MERKMKPGILLVAFILFIPSLAGADVLEPVQDTEL